MRLLDLFGRSPGSESRPLASYETLILRSRRALSPLFAGEHDTPLSGEGLEFLEIDDYAPGDDVRRINWRASARAAHPVVNRFAARRRLEVWLVYLAGGGMLAGEPVSKHQIASTLLVALSDTAHRMGDAPRVLLYRKEAESLLADTSRHAPRRLYEALSTLPLEGHRAPIQEMVEWLQNRLRRRSLILLVGDFFEPMDLSPLARHHELLCLQIRTPEEIDPSASGLYRDPASRRESRLTLDPLRRQRYKKALQNLDGENRARLESLGIPLGRFRTDEDPFPALAALLGARR
ncbi:DUF58 domain-containing protein [Nitratifractor sp.]